MLKRRGSGQESSRALSMDIAVLTEMPNPFLSFSLTLKLMSRFASYLMISQPQERLLSGARVLSVVYLFIHSFKKN